jgi:hypothetical protein
MREGFNHDDALPPQLCEILVTVTASGFDEKYLDRIFTVSSACIIKLNTRAPE